MPRIPFDKLPSASRLWIFPAERSLSPEEEHELLNRADAFLEKWEAHGQPLTCARDWRYHRFLLVAVDEDSVPPSGCSIDAMTNLLKKAGADFGVTFLDYASVYYRKNGEVERVSRSEFKDKVDDGEVGLHTPVFDHSITRVLHLRAGGWEKPAGASWHRQAFFPEE